MSFKNNITFYSYLVRICYLREIISFDCHSVSLLFHKTLHFRRLEGDTPNPSSRAKPMGEGKPILGDDEEDGSAVVKILQETNKLLERKRRRVGSSAVGWQFLLYYIFVPVSTQQLQSMFQPNKVFLKCLIRPTQKKYCLLVHLKRA